MRGVCQHTFEDAPAVFTGTMRTRACSSCDYGEVLLDVTDAWVPFDEYLDRTTIRSLVDDHLQGRANRRLLIWSLLAVEQWCQTFLADRRHVPVC